MDLAFSPEDRAFYEHVRETLKAGLPADIEQKERLGQRLGKEDMLRWQDVLARHNWLAAGWPKEYGGPGFNATRRYLFEQAYGSLYAPPPVQFGITMVGPVIYNYANEEQKARFLPPIRENKVWWCQGYSEPGAGSDLASLKTRAVREGDHYIVNGQKTWTTWAHWADWMFCLVKTDTSCKPQAGISFLLIDMKTPGISVRPIKTIDGDHEVNEVFLENVKVPAENLIGAEGAGWGYGKALLEHERFIMSGSARSRRNLKTLREDIAPGSVFEARIAELEIELKALEFLELRLLSSMNAGGNPGPRASALKIRGTEISQAVTRLRLDMLGPDAAPVSQGFMEADGAEPAGLPHAAMALPTYLNLRKLTIWGGSNEIQRMVMAKATLGL
ncbi:MAG: acyl-CoA dehydrogenase family protein [Cohaesibacter sp.]|jgi:alkylation response protein AidB-like acyl-CoA dehydrogenase|nr:acyl-CoA dehydrogenase family protein [Cohaesibacter sp.]